MPTVEANGVNMYYELTGAQGEPMLLIHGSWGDHNNWSHVVPGLSQNFRVVTYDRRGHSKSEKTTTQGSVEEDALDAHEVLSRLRLAPAHIVGNSYGANIALNLAAIRQSAFLSITVHEPPLFDLLAGEPSEATALEGMKRVRAVIKLLESGDKTGGARQFVDTIAFGPGQWQKLSPELKETFIANADTWLDETRDPRGLSLDLKALSRFKAPAFLSYGGKSAPFFRPIVEKVAKALSSSRVEGFPEDGHTPHISNPNAFVKRVTEFARSIA